VSGLQPQHDTPMCAGTGCGYPIVPTLTTEGHNVTNPLEITDTQRTRWNHGTCTGCGVTAPMRVTVALQMWWSHGAAAQHGYEQLPMSLRVESLTGAMT